MRTNETLSPSDVLSPYWKGTVAGFPTYEGVAYMGYIHRRPGVQTAHPTNTDILVSKIPINARLLIGADVFMSQEVFGSSLDIFSQIFFNDAYGLLSYRIGLFEWGLRSGVDEEVESKALRVIIDRSYAFPDTPITLVYTHGLTKDGEHYLRTMNRTYIQYPELITEVMKFDRAYGRRYSRSDMTVLLATCNADAVTMDDEALLIYRKGIAGVLARTGELVISRST